MVEQWKGSSAYELLFLLKSTHEDAGIVDYKILSYMKQSTCIPAEDV
jgi:hypothetical protein